MTVNRKYLTNLILSALEYDPAELEPGDDRVWHVGDHEKPVGGGWQGPIGQSDFVPYFILMAVPSQRPTGDIAHPTSDVWFGYAITTVARSREGVEDVSAVARERVSKLTRQKTTDDRTVGRIEIIRYGGNDRIPMEPPLYLVTDQFTVYTTK